MQSNRLESWLTPPPVEWLGGLPIMALNRQETAERIIADALVRRGRALPAIYTSANGQKVSGAKRCARTRELLLAADGISADGQSLVFASKLVSRGNVAERVATTDIFHDIARQVRGLDFPMYVLGASETENRLAIVRALALYPWLRIVGSHSGYFHSAADLERIVDEISRLQPALLWLSLGFPRELEFATRWRERLSGVGAVKTSGGLLNFLSGTHTRAPTWMQASGLEWLHRIYLEPRRLAWRYLTTCPHAAYLLWRGRDHRLN
jgi:exopolysaccharide biosynthesis WecB/TagA/CpsF family protein